MSAVEAKEIDFVVLTEDFSRFLLKDGTIIKAKIVLKKIFFSPIMSPEGYPQEMGFDAVNIITAFVPQSLKRPPPNQPPNVAAEIGTEMKFEEQEGKNQQYMTTNGFQISIKPILTKVFRYDKYNQYGEPVYNVFLQSITNIDKIESTG